MIVLTTSTSPENVSKYSRGVSVVERLSHLPLMHTFPGWQQGRKHSASSKFIKLDSMILRIFSNLNDSK